jgi:hypothetical protein
VKEKLDSSFRWNDDEGCREPSYFVLASGCRICQYHGKERK